MTAKASALLAASKQASKQASKRSVTLPLFSVNGKTAHFLRRILPVFVRAGCAFFVLPCGRRNFFAAHSLSGQ